MDSSQSLDGLVENVNLNRLIRTISKSHYGMDDYMIGLAYYTAILNNLDKTRTIKGRLSFMYDFTNSLNEIAKSPDWQEKINSMEEEIKKRRKIVLKEGTEFSNYIHAVGRNIIHSIRGLQKHEGLAYLGANKQRDSVTSRYVPEKELDKILLEEYQIIVHKIDKAMN